MEWFSIKKSYTFLLLKMHFWSSHDYDDDYMITDLKRNFRVIKISLKANSEIQISCSSKYQLGQGTSLSFYSKNEIRFNFSCRLRADNGGDLSDNLYFYWRGNSATEKCKQKSQHRQPLFGEFCILEGSSSHYGWNVRKRFFARKLLQKNINF